MSNNRVKNKVSSKHVNTNHYLQMDCFCFKIKSLFLRKNLSCDNRAYVVVFTKKNHYHKQRTFLSETTFVFFLKRRHKFFKKKLNFFSIFLELKKKTMALSTQEIEVEYVIYPKDGKKSKFTAVAVSPLKLDAKDPRLQDICIFSQFPLKECERIGTLVYSETKKNEGPLQWKYLCNGKTTDTKNVHLFDIEYLKPYLDLKSAEYAHCPLCKSGIYEEKKEHVEEFDIDTMEQLVQKRDEAKTANDLMLQLFQEQLIVEKACSEKWDPSVNKRRIDLNEKQLIETLQHWQSIKKIDEFRPKLLQSIRTAMEKDISNVVRLILNHSGYNYNSNSNSIISANNSHDMDDERKTELLALVNYGCSVEAYDCVECIFKIQKKLPIEQRPTCLANAIKTGNTDLMELVLNYLKSLDRMFTCDECFAQCIKSDNVTMAKDILLLRWHKPRDEDYQLAERMDNAVWAFLSERRHATAIISTAADSSQDLQWDDEEWDNDDEWADDDAQNNVVVGKQDTAADADFDADADADFETKDDEDF
ncbi:hypothetical protein RFI_05267 [Reticulomyxa filosa]|uniref:Uncharacterized protein n=1 Tax=Reticulomyxa filosa TaxID=46433 RepID=X6NZW0_RETFI|nr:hypothetical protein RFI_05267 [Reticulomyxa filosa]|eukprot:ETO31850.1 hypothetical protein RFI_05267 [Reticulomyxa filosa]